MVSFCNIKTVNIIAASTYINSNQQTFNKSIFDYASPYGWINNQHYAIRNLINTDNNLTSVTRKELGYKIEDMLVSSKFNTNLVHSIIFPIFIIQFTEIVIVSILVLMQMSMS